MPLPSTTNNTPAAVLLASMSTPTSYFAATVCALSRSRVATAAHVSNATFAGSLP